MSADLFFDLALQRTIDESERIGKRFPNLQHLETLKEVRAVWAQGGISSLEELVKLFGETRGHEEEFIIRHLKDALENYEICPNCQGMRCALCLFFGISPLPTRFKRQNLDTEDKNQLVLQT